MAAPASVHSNILRFRRMTEIGYRRGIRLLFRYRVFPAREAKKCKEKNDCYLMRFIQRDSCVGGTTHPRSCQGLFYSSIFLILLFQIPILKKARGSMCCSHLHERGSVSGEGFGNNNP